MMKTTMSFAAVVIGVAGLAGLAEVTIAKQAPVVADQTAVARGARAWADNCASCHNNRSPLEKTDAEWEVATTHMRVRANIPGNVARDIIAFLQASNDQRPISAPATSSPQQVVAPSAAPALTAGNAGHGARIFGETCVACHGANGKGAIEGVPPLSGALAKSDDVLMRHMIEGFQSPGSPMPMPARGGNPQLTDQDLADVLAYLRKDLSH